MVKAFRDSSRMAFASCGAMRKLTTLAALLFVACASTPKISGRYGVVFLDPAITPAHTVTPEDAIVNALRNELSTVDVIASSADDSYDAVIVFSWKSSAPNYANRSEYDVNGFPRHRRFSTLLNYEIVRGGRTVTKGVARITPVIEPEQKGYSPLEDSSLRNSYDQGIQVARQVLKALRAAPSGGGLGKSGDHV